MSRAGRPEKADPRPLSPGTFETRPVTLPPISSTSFAPVEKGFPRTSPPGIFETIPSSWPARLFRLVSLFLAVSATGFRAESAALAAVPALAIAASRTGAKRSKAARIWSAPRVSELTTTLIPVSRVWLTAYLFLASSMRSFSRSVRLSAQSIATVRARGRMLSTSRRLTPAPW